MLQKHYTEAIQLYQQAIGDPRLELSGMHAAERADLEAFSRFRLIVAYALLADEAAAQAALADMSATQPGHVYYEVAQAFWAAYLPQHNIAAGCAAVGRLARASPSLTDVLSDYGYTHTDLTAADVCPFPL